MFSPILTTHIPKPRQTLDQTPSRAAAVYVQKPQLVTKHVVPAALSLLNSSRPEERAASSALLARLAELLGPALCDHASNMSAPVQARVREAVAAAKQRS